MRTTLMDCPVDVLTREETITLAAKAMRERVTCQHVALNVAKLVKARTDAELDADVRNADIIGIDGKGISLAFWLLGRGMVPRYAGCDLFEDMMAMCAVHGFKPYILGAKADVLENAIGKLQSRYPGLIFAGWHHGYFDGRDEEIVREIAASGADCLFLAMPTPRKERFMAHYREAVNVPFIMGIGGTVDVVAGKVRRAPRMVQSLGLEWLYRLMQEPRRMWKRYLSTNSVFAWLLVREMAHRFTGTGGGRPKGPDVPAAPRA